MSNNDDAFLGQGHEENEWLRFSVEKQAYAISVLQVKEILGSCDITPVPGAPEFVRGIINLRGNIVAIADARVRLGVAAAANDTVSWAMILDLDGELAGLLVDEVSEVVTLGQEDIRPFPDGHESNVLGVADVEDTMLILLDAFAIIGKGSARAATYSDAA